MNAGDMDLESGPTESAFRGKHITFTRACRAVTHRTDGMTLEVRFVTTGRPAATLVCMKAMVTPPNLGTDTMPICSD